MSLLKTFIQDESGAILSAETALLGTLGVMGVTAGLTAATNSVQDELADVAYSFRSLNQSYSIPAQQNGGAWTAGSSFTQAPAEESVNALREEYLRKKSAQESVQTIPPAPDSDDVGI